MERVIIVHHDRAALVEAVMLLARQITPPWLRTLKRVNGIILVLGHALFGAGLAVLVGRMFGWQDVRGVAPVGALIGVAALSIIPGLRWRRALQSFANSRFALAPQTWIFGAEGLAVEGRDVRAEVGWAGIDALVRGRLSLSVSFAGSTWVLPRSAFASNAEMDEVEALIRERRAAAAALP